MTKIDLYRTRRRKPSNTHASIHPNGQVYLSSALVTSAGWENLDLVEATYDDVARLFTIRPTTVRSPRSLRLNGRPLENGTMANSRAVFHVAFAELSGVAGQSKARRFPVRIENGAIVIAVGDEGSR